MKNIDDKYWAFLPTLKSMLFLLKLLEFRERSNIIDTDFSYRQGTKMESQKNAYHEKLVKYIASIAATFQVIHKR